MTLRFHQSSMFLSPRCRRQGADARRGYDRLQARTVLPKVTSRWAIVAVWEVHQDAALDCRACSPTPKSDCGRWCQKQHESSLTTRFARWIKVSGNRRKRDQAYRSRYLSGAAITHRGASHELG